MKKKTILLICILALGLALLLCACGASAAEPKPEPTPEPTPTPTPFVEPTMNQGGAAYFDGKELASGIQSQNGVPYVKLSEAVEALGSELEHESDSEDFAFAWRKSRVTLTAGSTKAAYLEKDRTLDAEPLLCSEGEDLFVPVESFCAAAEIGYFYDEEYDTTCCTPASGDWALPENYVVPVLMYHAIGHAPDDANLVLAPETLEEEIQWMQENGFTPIWFEDLWHVEDFEKPVIMVFDDGWYSLYDYLTPLAEKYQIKMVIPLITKATEKEGGNMLDVSEVLEMYDTGWFSFESHSVTHPDNLGFIPEEEQQKEIYDSYLWLTRLLHREPITFVYPSGASTPHIQDLVREHYRFAAKMVGKPYNTSDDPTMICRFFVEQKTPTPWLGRWMLKALDDPTINNYCPIQKD